MTDLHEVIERGAQAICDTRNYPGRYDQLSRGNVGAQQKWFDAAKAMLSTLNLGDRIGENLWVSDKSVCEAGATGSPKATTPEG